MEYSNQNHFGQQPAPQSNQPNHMGHGSSNMTQPGMSAQQPESNSAMQTAVHAGGPADAQATAPAKAPKKLDPAAEKIANEMRVFDRLATELREQLNLQATFDDRCNQVNHHATELFGVAPTWAAFYREILGCDGVLRTMFPDAASRERYEQTAQYEQVLEMLTALRSRDLPENDPTESQRMVTIRMPKSLYDVICAEANGLGISVNKLCISRITQRLDKAVVPKTVKKRRGRRPGSAGELRSV